MCVFINSHFIDKSFDMILINIHLSTMGCCVGTSTITLMDFQLKFLI
jgi:hypothetical protein